MKFPLPPEAVNLLGVIAGAAGAYFVLGIIAQHKAVSASVSDQEASDSLAPITPQNPPPPSPLLPAATSGKPIWPPPFQGPQLIAEDPLIALPGAVYMASISTPPGSEVSGLVTNQKILDFAHTLGFRQISVDKKPLPGWPGANSGTRYFKGTFSAPQPLTQPRSKSGFSVEEAFRVA